MIFKETGLQGAYIIEIDKRLDDRGFFARAWCEKEFRVIGLDANLVQANISFSRKKGTLRGIHYQIAPFEEAKTVRCTRGAIYDVLIDLRRESPTYRHWIGVELTAESYQMIYVPKGFAKGFITLEDETEVNYGVSTCYAPSYERGIRWNDPAFAIEWPDVGPRTLSEKDQSWPDFTD